MAAPDPNGIHLIEYGDGRFGIVAELWHHNKGGGSWGARRLRMNTIARRIAKGDWRCRWFGDPISTVRRADALYCREGCRKASARLRRRERSIR